MPQGSAKQKGSSLEMKLGPQHSGAHATTTPLPKPTPTPTTQFESSEPSFCHQYVYKSIWPGLGLFGESYLLFSIGTLKPLWENLFPNCFSAQNDGVCSPALLGSLTYSVVLGVMTGMVGLGWAANHLGRRKGSIITASIMATGAWGLTLASIFLADDNSANNQNDDVEDAKVVWLFRALSILFFIFGIGVGGEYPLSASSASERAMGELQQKTAMDKLLEQQQQQHDGYSTYYNEMYDTKLPPSPKKKRKHKQSEGTTGITTNANTQSSRGRQIQLVFSMQGMGIFCNAVIMTALLLITGQGKIIDDDQMPEYSNSALLSIWRIMYALGAVMLTYVLISRYRYLEESQVWQDDKEQREQVVRERLLEAVVTNKKEEERRSFAQPEFVATVSSVSSLSAPVSF